MGYVFVLSRRDRRLPPQLRNCLQILGIALAFFAAGRIGWLLAGPPVGEQSSLLWLPAGVGVTALLVMGIRTWPGIALGAFLFHLSIVPPAAAAAITAGTTLAAVCAWVLLRWMRFRLELDRLRDALALVLGAAFAAMLVNASVGTATLVLLGLEPERTAWAIWTQWWASDVMGVLVVTPLLLVARTIHRPATIRPARALEVVALLVGTASAMLVATSGLNLLFLAFPFLIWAALRFQLAGVAPCALIVSNFAAHTAVRAQGAFAGRDLLENMIILQLFNGVVVLSALLMAAVITQWLNSREEIECTAVRLGQVIDHLERRKVALTPDIAASRDASTRA